MICKDSVYRVYFQGSWYVTGIAGKKPGEIIMKDACRLDAVPGEVEGSLNRALVPMAERGSS